MNCNKCFFTTASQRVKIIRVVLNLKCSTFSNFLGISSVWLYHWEHEKVVLNDKQKDRLRYVGINPQWIDYGTGDPFILNQNIVAKNIVNFKQ